LSHATLKLFQETLFNQMSSTMIRSPLSKILSFHLTVPSWSKFLGRKGGNRLNSLPSQERTNFILTAQLRPSQ